MRRYGVIVGAISVISFMVVGFLYLHARRPSAADLSRVQHNLSPYELSAADLAPLKAEATGGNCKAAETLTRYYFDVALDPYSGLSWVRVAAKTCPDAGAKIALAKILMHNKNDPKTAEEIARLVVQIEKIDPYWATELKSELDGK